MIKFLNVFSTTTKKKRYLRAESTFTSSLVRINSPRKHDVEMQGYHPVLFACVCAQLCSHFTLPFTSCFCLEWILSLIDTWLDCSMHENQHHKISKWRAHCSAFSIRSERQIRRVNFTFPSEEKRGQRSKKGDKHS